jgi:hypothetical protein
MAEPSLNASCFYGILQLRASLRSSKLLSLMSEVLPIEIFRISFMMWLDGWSVAVAGLTSGRTDYNYLSATTQTRLCRILYEYEMKTKPGTEEDLNIFWVQLEVTTM